MPSRIRPGPGLCAIATLLSGFAGSYAAGAFTSAQAFDVIDKGRYLSIAADCASCHDDPVTGKPMAGGRPIETPFGKVLAPNITPDRETGIGGWSDEQFIAAIKSGEMPDHRRLYPAMPFPYYAKMSRDDVLALRAYLNTVDPVHQRVEANQLPFPFSLRTSMWVWDGLYFEKGDFKQDARKSAVWNRGAYLVEALGHCQACHTPKTALGGDKKDQAFRGVVIQGWTAPDITDSEGTGLSQWSVDDIADYLQTGHNRFAAATGPMAEVVHYSSTHMTVDDLKAMGTYLKDLPGGRAPATPRSAQDPVMVAGKAIYDDACSACHSKDGSGVPYLFPNLAESTGVAAHDATSIVRVVLNGAQSIATDREPTGPSMPSYGWQLSDVQVAAVATYLRNSWGHAAPAVSEGEVKAARRQLALGKNPG